MRAMVLDGATSRSGSRTSRTPCRRTGQVLLRVRACGVCRTDLHIVDGELTKPKLPLVLGHQVVGQVLEGSDRFAPGERVGVPWLGWTGGDLPLLRRRAREPLRRRPLHRLRPRRRLRGARRRGRALLLPGSRTTTRTREAAPLLCAGLIGFRSLRLAGDAEALGLYGFGASAHIVCQVAVAQGRRVFAGTRAGDEETQAFARSLGAVWAGDALAGPPEELDAVILFAPVGDLVPAALRHVRKGGRVVSAGIHMSDIPSFPYELLWGERSLLSVANLTRQDGEEFLALAPSVPVRAEVETFPLDGGERGARPAAARRAARRRGARALEAPELDEPALLADVVDLERRVLDAELARRARARARAVSRDSPRRGRRGRARTGRESRR